MAEQPIDSTSTPQEAVAAAAVDSIIAPEPVSEDVDNKILPIEPEPQPETETDDLAETEEIPLDDSPPSPPPKNIASQAEPNDDADSATAPGMSGGERSAAPVADDTPQPPPLVASESDSALHSVALTPVQEQEQTNGGAGDTVHEGPNVLAQSETVETPVETPTEPPTFTVSSAQSPTEVPSPVQRTSSTPRMSGPGSRPPSAILRSAQHHSRRSSTSTTISLTQHPGGHAPQLSSILITPPLKVLVNSKEARKSASFKAASERALQLCEGGADGGNAAFMHPREIFEPLRLAISNPQTTSVPILVTSLDLLAKLISHSFFSEPNGPPPGMSPLPDLITHTITLAYTENTPPQVALQVVKALMAIVLSTDPGMLVHQSSLLKAVRTVYNVFLLSNDTNNQVVAQGGLTQMVHHIFSRVQRPEDKRKTLNGTQSPHPESGPGTPLPSDMSQSEGQAAESAEERVGDNTLTLESFSQPNPNDEVTVAPARLGDDLRARDGTQARLPTQTISIEVPNGDALDVPEGDGDVPNEGTDDNGRPIPTQELFVKDAFLVFRALCKLSMKSLVTEAELDLRSHAMRSKLLSLHLVLTILRSHADMFYDPSITIPSNTSAEQTPFLQATKQYLCQSLSRNAVSPVNQVFELSTEIFWCILKSMRAPLKKEIEVLMNEIFIPILEMRHSTIRQKSLILGVFIRLCQDPQALVEIYLNYDCDRAAPENIYEKLMNIVSKIGQTHFAPPTKEELQAGSSKHASGSHGPSIPPSLSTSALAQESPQYAGLSPEIKLRRQSLECLVAALKSLVAWSSTPKQHGDENVARQSVDEDRRNSMSELSTTPTRDGSRRSMSGYPSQSVTPDIPIGDDDVNKLESEKMRKTMLQDGIKKFNFRPKRGIEFLVQNGFIPSHSPHDIAHFLLSNDGLSKAVIGEYLGEGEEENIATMHAFVDMQDLASSRFTDALRAYLQTFRLPGEAQKIDRFMLKFAERYLHQNPGTVFANADAAYILAFSVIMLNTDQHNKNLKTKRMTKQDFVKNNKGINNGEDLPEELLGEIYDEIQTNEIKMKDEVEAAIGGPAGLASVGRDLQREAFLAQSENMANKTEAMLKSMARSQRRGRTMTDHFYSASRIEHVRFMFDVAWMPFLAGLSAQLQETEDMEVVDQCLEGLRCAIRIGCVFDMELERNAFVGTLAKFTYLSNIIEMKPKNMEAIKTLLDIAVTDGNNLKGSWKDVLTCVSQLERMQLISSGMDVPDLNRRASTASKKSNSSKNAKKRPAEELAEESRSSQVTVAADKVFSLSQNLSGSAIVDFVRALSEVSWEEIQASSSTPRPRMFSLQKLVEISYYNMGRIRLEWSNIWNILGEHFNQVCCHNNPNVSFFALDALRQLAMNFLQKEELTHFQFQKDFLRPFEYTMVHNVNTDAREMVLQCLQQMLQARVMNLRSGWRTMFSVFSAASRVMTERVANYAFELVTLVYREHFALVARYGAFADLAACLTDFCKVTKFQKISLQAIEMLKGLVPKIVEIPDVLPVAGSEIANGKAKAQNPQDDPMLRYWLPVLNAFYDIIMTGEDLEVRRVALDCLFGTLKAHGQNFSIEFWNTICQQTLFPIFSVLSNSNAVKFKSAEDMSVWLSTTLISALRDLIDLYTYYFETLQVYLNGVLDILIACICQENDTLARIGASCFQQLLESNVTKLSAENWEIIVSAFVQLFRTTTAYHLFDPSLSMDRKPPADYVDDDQPFNKFVAPAPLEPVQDHPPALGDISYGEQRRIFKTIIVKCVLQLLLIETTHELLQNEGVYNTIPAEHLLRFMGVLDDSWRFARKFNANKDLRVRLWKVGFMKQLPNLLKQESSSAATLITALLRMYRDPREAHMSVRGGVLDRLVPLGQEVTRDFIAIDAASQPRNIAAWSPVVSDIVRGVADFDDNAFDEHVNTFYPLVADLLLRDIQPEMRLAVRDFFLRAGQRRGMIPQEAAVPEPTVKE